MKKIMAVALVMLLLVGCSAEKETEDAQGNEVKDLYQVGERIELKDFSFVVNSVRFDDGDEYYAPEEGKTWLVVDLTFENKSDEETIVSSMMSVTIKDDEGRSKDLTFGPDLNGSFDGTVLGGEKISGELAFEVDKEGKLFLYFNNDFLGGTTLKIELR